MGYRRIGGNGELLTANNFEVFPTPVGFGFASVLGPTRGQVAKVGNSPPFEFVGGTPHNPPPWGLRPLDPRLPALVGFGLASVLGPTRGRGC
jgi:hypothetical protein